MIDNYTALALIVDRSGSMRSIASDVVGGVKQFIGDQKKKEGKASLTVVQFDHEYQVVHEFKPIAEVDEEKFGRDYAPRGATALFDAIARTTLEMSQKIEAMAPADRPQRVVVAVMTDGLENASREFTEEKVKELIKQKEAAGWDFMFLGATLNAIEVAKTMGFAQDKAAVYSTSNAVGCIALIGEKITRARLGEQVAIAESERDALVQSKQGA